MGTPVQFDGANINLAKPPGVEDAECQSMPALRTQEITEFGPRTFQISCWELSEEELAMVKDTGRVWLMVVGPVHPMVSVEGKRPFRQIQLTGRDD